MRASLSPEAGLAEDVSALAVRRAERGVRSPRIRFPRLAGLVLLLALEPGEQRCSGAETTSPVGPSLLTNAFQIRALSPDEAERGHRVRLQGVVTTPAMEPGTLRLQSLSLVQQLGPGGLPGETLVIGAAALLAIVGMAGWVAAYARRFQRQPLRQVRATGLDPRTIKRVSLRTPAAWTVLACGGAMSILAWRLTSQHAGEHAGSVFETQVEQLHTILRYQLEAYETIVRSAGGLLAGSLEVSREDWESCREEWQSFVHSLRLPELYPGLLGLGFHPCLSASELSNHVQKARAAGLSAYTITPAGARTEYAPTLLLEPANEQNRRYIGFDLLSSLRLREALERARDSGQPAMTERVQLAQDVGQPPRPGFLMVHPVYGALGLEGWRAGRREALRGYVSASFRLRDLFQHAVGQRAPGIDLELYDANSQEPLLHWPERSAGEPGQSTALNPRFRQVKRLASGGRAWSLGYSSTAQFEHALHSHEPWGVLGSGLTLTVLLFGLLRVQGRARAHAQALLGRVTDELEERKRAETQVRQLSAQLDQRVTQRTAELAASNHALTETAARLRAVLEHEPECVKIVGLDGCLLDMNPAGLAMIEAPSLDAVRGAPVRELVHPEDRAAFLELQQRVAEGEQGSLQFRMRGLRGTERWMETSSVPLRDGQGRIASVLSVSRDITSRRAVETALRALAAGATAGKREEFFRTLVRSLAGAFQVRYAFVGQSVPPEGTSLETIAVWANGEPAENFTYALAGTPCAEVLDQGPCFYASGVAAQFPEDRLLVQMQIESYFGMPLLDSHQRLLGIIVVMDDRPFTPTADQRSMLAIFAGRAGAELERLSGEKILRESEERFRTLAEASPIGISRTDASGRCTYNNQRWLEFTGQTFEGSLGDGWANAIHPEDRERVLQDWLKTAREGGTATDELRILRPDGRTRWLLSRASPIRDQAGRLLGHVGTHEDITERKRAEEARASLEAQLRQAQKLEAIGTLAGGIAHDFNNMLGAIMGFTQVAKLDAAGQAQVQESLEGILQSSRRARDLVNQILAFSRLEESRRQPLLLGPIVKEIAKLLRATLPVTTELSVCVAAEMPPVEADATQLHQVLMNLVTNSAHAMRGATGRIDISVAPLEVDSNLAGLHAGLHAGQYVCLSVRDTGAGMDEAAAERAFDPFFTTKGPGEGTGLGLSVVHGIVKSHQGAIRLSTAPGQGTTVDVFLPAIDAPEPPPAAPKADPLRGRGERILLVDDEPALVSVGQRALCGLGYQVTACSNPVDALARFRAQPAEFDLVLTDLAMPQLSGTDFARELLACRPELPIVLTTGFGATVSPEAARQLGIREVLLKPAEIEDLSAAVFRALQP